MVHFCLQPCSTKLLMQQPLSLSVQVHQGALSAGFDQTHQANLSYQRKLCVAR